MHRRLLPLIVFTLLFFSSLSAQDHFSVFLGSNTFIGGESSTGARITPVGVTVGFLIPVNISELQIYYKVRGRFHSAEYRRSSAEDYDSYLQVSNTILIGKELRSSAFKFLPQIGFGAVAETLFRKWGSGYSNGDLEAELSLIVTREYDKVAVGLIADIETRFVGPGSRLAPPKQVTISALLAF